jgi:drug/metabolite transporter (DMT)-like permease
MKWILVFMLICATTIGDVFRSLGMRRHGEIHDFRPGAIGTVLSTLGRNKYVIISTCSIAPMSFAVPMSAATFIPETLLAKYLLREAVDWRRWIGVGLIATGVVFVSQ